MENGNRGYRVLFEALGAIGVALTALLVGYTISSGQWEANLKSLESKNTVLEEKLEAANASITDLKIQLSKALFENTDSKPQGMSVDVQEMDLSVETPTPSVETSRIEPIEVVVSEGSSANLFDGGLFVSVVATAYEGDPMRHNVTVKIGAPGQEGLEIDRKDVGYSVIYQGYEVRILAVGTLSATFLVRNIE